MGAYGGNRRAGAGAAMLLAAAVAVADPARELEFRRMADGTTIAPDLGATFEQFASVAIDGDQLIFSACASAPPKAWGIYAQALRDGRVRRLVPVGGVPDLGGHVLGLTAAGGLLVYHGQSGDPAGLVQGLYLMRDGQETRIADTRMIAPGESAPFLQFSSLYTDGRHVSFTALIGTDVLTARDGVFLYDSTNGRLVQRYAKDRAMPGGSTFLRLLPADVDDGALAFLGFGQIADGLPLRVIVDRGGVPEIVADKLTPVPGRAGECFTDFGPLTRMSGDQVAFQGHSSVRGIYKRVEGVLERIVDSSEPLPDVTASLGDVPILAFDGGRSAFIANNGGGRQIGLFAQMDGRLRKIVAPGDVLDGKTVRMVALWPDGFQGRQLAFLVQFTDLTPALYVVTERVPGGDDGAPASRPAIRTISATVAPGAGSVRSASGGAASVAITWSAVAGATYAVDAAPSPAGPFTCLASNIPFTAAEQSFMDATAAGARRFYRVRVE